LQQNDLPEQSGINDLLVALALLDAESDPKQKGLMVLLKMNMLAQARGKRMNNDLNTPENRTKVKSRFAPFLF